MTTLRLIDRKLCLIIALTLAGCAVGPDYEPPQANIPESWSVAADGKEEAQSDPKVELANWWRNFDDPLMIQLIEQALETNLDLAQAQARIREARASYNGAVAGLLPTVSASSDYRRSDSTSRGSSVITDSGSTQDISRSGERSLYQAGFDASWELDIFGGVRRSLESAESNLDATMYDARDIQVSLASEVALHYLAFRALQIRYSVAEKNLETQRNSAQIARTRFNAGFASDFDVATAEAQVASTSAQLPSLLSQKRQEAYTLALLLGQEPLALLASLDGSPAKIPAAPKIPLGLPSDLLKRRPDIKRAEETLHAATADIGVAMSDLYPHFSLSAFLGVDGSRFNNLGNWTNNFWNAGASLAYPLFDGGKITSNVEGRMARRDEVLLAYRQSVLTALSDVETALSGYESERKRNADLRSSVESSQRALKSAQELYAAGAGEYLNVLTAERTLLASEDALAQNQQQIAASVVSLFKALGGGWDPGVL